MTTQPKTNPELFCVSLDDPTSLTALEARLDTTVPPAERLDVDRALDFALGRLGQRYCATAYLFVALRDASVVAHCIAGLAGVLKPSAIPVGLIGFVGARRSAASIPGALFSNACQVLWAHGAERIWAPVDDSVWRHYRFQVLGHGLPSHPGEPQNDPELPALFRQLGFKTYARWTGWDLTRDHLETIAARPTTNRPGFSRFPLRRECFDRDLDELQEIAEATFADNFGMHRLDRPSFHRRFSFLKEVLHPGLCFFVRDSARRTVGFVTCYPHPADRGRRDPRACYFGLGLLPETRGCGIVNNLVVPTIVESMLELGASGMLGAPCKEGATFMDKVTQPTRLYDIFELRPHPGSLEPSTASPHPTWPPVPRA